MSPALEAAIRPIEVVEPSRKLRVERLGGFAGSIFRQQAAAAFPDERLQRQRRVLHVSIALLMLIVLAPLMLAIAVLIKLTSPGPVIYRQTRVGLDRRRGESVDLHGRRLLDYGGKLFTIYKFRTMRADPHATLQVWAKPNDDRVTRIGRVLRTYRLDELPQLVNVIRGDMNLVGPRPEQPNIVLQLREVYERYTERQRILPGLTGWAQINHHYDRSVDDVGTKLRYDLEYVNRHSVGHDLGILLKTVPVVLLKKGGW